MSIDSSEFVEFAKRHVGLGSSEIDWRVAASRAYYGAFHFASLSSDSVGAHDPLSSFGGGSHSRVIAFYAEGPQSDSICRKRKVISYMLAQARDTRCNADYDIDRSFPQNTATAQILSCEKIIGKLTDIMLEVAA